VAVRLTPLRALGVAPFLLYAIFVAWHGNLRWDHAAVALLAVVLGFGGPRAHRLFKGICPLGLTAVLYDSLHYLGGLGVTESSVHVCDLRSLELALFGIRSGARLLTPSDFFQAHSVVALDVFCSIPYAVFLYACVAFVVATSFRDSHAMRRFGWAFFVSTLVAVVVHHVAPTAPPWYEHLHGCVVDTSARANEGPNLARVDALLGTSYFTSMYRRSSDVFGALPSLHVVYPVLIALEGWAIFGRWFRIGAVVFAVWMCFAAVYLDHHWVVDVAAGLVLAASVFVSVRVAELKGRALLGGASPTSRDQRQPARTA
jgi:membrane-associated phospholipid phosphatase